MKISLELALLAREKGFNENCDGRYNEQTGVNFSYKDNCIQKLLNQIKNNPGYEYHYVKSLEEDYNYQMNNDDYGFFILMPTQDELNTWLRNTHNISVLVEHGRMKDESFGYFTRIYYITGKHSSQEKVFEYSEKYETALEQGLLIALNRIKKI